MHELGHSSRYPDGERGSMWRPDCRSGVGETSAYISQESKKPGLSAYSSAY